MILVSFALEFLERKSWRTFVGRGRDPQKEGKWILESETRSRVRRGRLHVGRVEFF